MKTILLTILFIVASAFSGIPQKMHDKQNKQKSKIEQLEKIKLIDALELDEETSIRFFARRNQSKKEIDVLEKKSDEIMMQLENTINSDNPKDSQKQKSLITELFNTRQQIETEKQKFISSLSDILSTKQIAQLVVFERKFREEIRNILLDRKPPRNIEK